MFAAHISSDKGKDVEDVEALKRYPVLELFQDVFPAEVSKLQPHREVYFSIELVKGSALTSKEPYKMSTRELVELMLHLKEILERYSLSQMCHLVVHRCCS